MGHPRFSSATIVERGQALYDQTIREKVEPSHHGEFLVVDIETGEFEIDASELAALERAQAKHPGAALYLMRVGYRAAHRIGGRLLAIPS
jgi:hypothetical protein